MMYNDYINLYLKTIENVLQVQGDIQSAQHHLQGSYVSWKSWNVLDFCNDNFQPWKVLENDRKSFKNPGKIKRLDKTPLFAENYPHSHVICSVRQAFPSFFLRNLEIQQLLYTYRTIKVLVSTPCVYIQTELLSWEN